MSLARLALPGILAQQGSADPLGVWNADLADAAAGTRETWLQFMGDSITLGGHGTGGDVWTNSFPALVRAELESGVPVDISGPGAVNVTPSAEAARFAWGRAEHLTYTGTWTTVSNGVGSSTVNDQVTFATTIDARYITVWYYRIFGTNRVDYRIDGGSWTSWTMNTGPSPISLQSRVFDCGSVGAHTLDIRVSAGTPVLDSFTASSGNGLQVHNAGRSGAGSDDVPNHLRQVGGAGHPIVAAEPSLTVLMIGSNDWNAQKALATYKSQVEARVATIMAGTGDLVLMSPPPVNIAEKPLTIAMYAAQIEAIATAEGVPYIDLHARWQAIDTTGFYDDALHPTPLGQADIAEAVLEVISA